MGDAAENPAAIAPADPADRPSRFRWRVIPAFLGCLFGLMATLGGVANTAAFVWLLNQGVPPSAHLVPGVLSASAMIVGGLLLIVGCVMLWRGRGRAALVICSGGALVLLATGLAGVPMPLA